MIEAAFAVIGAWVYAALLLILDNILPAWLVTFLGGYFLVAVVDLWRCWRAVKWQRATRLERALAALLLFPIASALWLPWDLGRALGTVRS